MDRTPGCLTKLERMNRALRHQKPDRIPISDFFWGAFLKRWRDELGLAADADIYRYYDLDWQVTIPNMDPKIRSFEIISQSDQEVTVRTGFGAIIRKKFDQAMPAFLGFDTNTIEKLEALEFDPAEDERRWFARGDNQIAGVGDGFARDTPPWIETVRGLYPDFPAYGSVCEGHEMLWRIIGSENVMMWIGEYPERLGRQIERVCEYTLALTKAQIKAGAGLLDGMVIWGDVAFKKCMLFSPAYWRRWFKPGLKAMVDACHEAGLPVIYHGCGNARKIFDDLIEIGIDAYNPLEAKAGLDVVDLWREYGRRLAFCGNMDVRTWAEAPMDVLESEVLRKLEAGRDGGFIFQSDHSVPPDISAERYEFVVKLVKGFRVC